MASAQILCAACGCSSQQASEACRKCGGRNVRVCGACGGRNSVAKGFCDKCGHSISELGTIAPPPPTLPPGSPAANIPVTAIRSAPEPGSAPGLDDLWTAPAPPPAGDANKDLPARASMLGRIINLLAAFAGVAAAAYGIWHWRESRRPEFLVPRLASEYLNALGSGDYAGAYGMFSVAAKKYCTEADFRASRDKTPWTWSNPRIVHQEPGAILLAYDLIVEGLPPRTDHLLFTLEGERWTRPYNWTLLRQIEEAFERGNPDKGLILAQAAVEVNSRDPMAWGYLCEAAYYRRSPDDAAQRCTRALELSQTYPSNLSLKSLYHLRSILADTYHHALKKHGLALDQFAHMLAFPGISAADQCQILLARAQVYAEISRPGESLSDLEQGSRLCSNPKDLAFIEALRRNLNPPDPD